TLATWGPGSSIRERDRILVLQRRGFILGAPEAQRRGSDLGGVRENPRSRRERLDGQLRLIRHLVAAIGDNLTKNPVPINVREVKVPGRIDLLPPRYVRASQR